MSFFTASKLEKDTIFGAAQTNIWPFLFCQSFHSFFLSVSLFMFPCSKWQSVRPYLLYEIRNDHICILQAISAELMGKFRKDCPDVEVRHLKVLTALFSIQTKTFFCGHLFLNPSVQRCILQIIPERINSFGYFLSFQTAAFVGNKY